MVFRIINNYYRLLGGIEPAEETHEMRRGGGDAAGGGAGGAAPDVEENGAPRAGDDRLRVVFDDQAIAVEVVAAAHDFVGKAGGLGAGGKHVVARRGGVVDPDIIRGEDGIGKPGGERGVAEGALQGEDAAGRAAVAFAFGAGGGEAVAAGDALDGRADLAPGVGTPLEEADRHGAAELTGSGGNQHGLAGIDAEASEIRRGGDGSGRGRKVAAGKAEQQAEYKGMD